MSLGRVEEALYDKRSFFPKNMIASAVCMIPSLWHLNIRDEDDRAAPIKKILSFPPLNKKQLPWQFSPSQWMGPGSSTISLQF